MMHFHCIRASQTAILHGGLFTCQSCTMLSFQSFRCHLHKMKQNPSGAQATNRVNSVHADRKNLTQTKTPPNSLPNQKDKTIVLANDDLALLPAVMHLSGNSNPTLSQNYSPNSQVPLRLQNHFCIPYEPQQIWGHLNTLSTLQAKAHVE